MKIPNNYKIYLNFSCDLLLGDAFFISSHLHPSPQTEFFWSDVLMKGIVDCREYELACLILKSWQSKREMFDPSDLEGLWERMKLEREKNHQKALRVWKSVSMGMAVAATLLLLVAIMFNVFRKRVSDWNETAMEILRSSFVYKDSSNVSLSLGDDRVILLEDDKVDIQYEEGQVVVNSQRILLGKTDAKEISFNSLVVPYGKRSKLILDDGSVILVNSGSTLLYPAEFGKGSREIFVDGEIFVKVVPDESRPFRVSSKMLEVTALGTSFNVTAYSSDADSKVVLVSGKVEVEDIIGKESVLSPGEMLVNNGEWSRIETVDVDDYILWTEGLYKFRSEKLEVILKRVSRYFNEEIICSPSVSGYRVSGKLDMSKGLDNVLESLTFSASVSFAKDGDKIVVTQ